MSTMPSARPALLLVGILLTGAALRAPITSIAPLLVEIRGAFALSTAEAGAIASLPLLMFAVGSPISILVARAIGLDRSLFAAMALVAAGILLRSAGPLWALFLGTGIIGLGLAIANVLLPSLLKRDFPRQIPNLTSAYASLSGVVAALGSVAIVPISLLPGWGWQGALLAFLILPVIAAAAWAPRLSVDGAPVGEAPAPDAGPLWRSALAWQVTGFFGLSSLTFYVIITWLPAILAEAGYSAQAAGGLHGVYQLVGAAVGVIVGPAISRSGNQKAAAAAGALATGASLLGLLLLPGLAILWAALMGIGGGTTFILGLSFFSLRAANVRQAAALSGMAQTAGYSFAAVAPPLAGVLHDWSGGWTAPLLLCAALCCVMAALGYRAGRARHA